MAKTQTISTLSPTIFSVGQGIYDGQLAEVAEMLNYAYGYGGTANLVNVQSGDYGAGTHVVRFPASSGYSTRYVFRVWIDADAVSITVRSTATFTASNSGRARFTIGGTNDVHNYSAGATTTDSGSLNTSATGTGWQDCTVELDHQVGSASTGCYLDSFSIRLNPITSSLPDPVSE